MKFVRLEIRQFNASTENIQMGWCIVDSYDLPLNEKRLQGYLEGYEKKLHMEGLEVYKTIFEESPNAVYIYAIPTVVKSK